MSEWIDRMATPLALAIGATLVALGLSPLAGVVLLIIAVALIWPRWRLVLAWGIVLLAVASLAAAGGSSETADRCALLALTLLAAVAVGAIGEERRSDEPPRETGR